MADTIRIAKNLNGDLPYQVFGRKALPLLVRQAEAGHTIFYSSLSQEIGMLNPRNLNYPLGSIGKSLEELSIVWGEKIPPIQCLVLNKETLLPSEGVGWFSIKKEDFSALSRPQQLEIVRNELAPVFAYQNWHKILDALKIRYVNPNISKFVAAAQSGGGGGESESHRRFKEFIARNPAKIGLPKRTSIGKTEVRLPSGDILDISFDARNEWVAAEVKSAKSDIADVTRGLFQCVKYRSVMEASQSANGKRRSARAVLVLEGMFPQELIPLRNILGIDVYDQIR